MSVFSTNQNRQFYVAKNVVDTVNDASTVGDIAVKTTANGVNKEFYFLVKGAKTVLKSDRIPVKNLSYIKSIASTEMVRPLKKVLVSLDPAVNGGKPVVGQDYILRINFRQFYGMSDGDQYFKDVAVRAISEDATEFYEKMEKALNKSFSREVGATETSNPYLTFEVDATGITITEKEQDWALGIEAQEPVLFDIASTTIYVNGVDVVWNKVEDKTPKKKDAKVGTTGVGNGKTIADMEWFYMGERGDQYRYAGYPNYIPTQYLVDADKEYNVLEIHYAFTDTGVNSYRSEKDITIVAPSDTTAIASLVAKIKEAIPDLEVETAPATSSDGD